ncbi:DUF1858 domain-containing protein [Aminobacter aganoensis]|uniref:Hybrid cluster-associated redox disulfide protein n=1 Tax=Aminobacter aganoensis TaxID=83264 RepID=A0A7X0KM78_9HYPH|nr:hybrid cluster-associated redox disulfide protein [Aminobacter aganoensis]
MTEPEAIDLDMTVDEIMRRWPATIRVMIRHKMLCIGCPIAIFHTVEDACRAHDIDVASFSEDLLQAMKSDPMANAPSAFFAKADDGVSSSRARRRVEHGSSVGAKIGR